MSSANRLVILLFHANHFFISMKIAVMPLAGLTLHNGFLRGNLRFHFHVIVTS